MNTPWLLVLIALTVGVGLLALYSLGTGRRVLRAFNERPTEVVFATGGFGGNGPPIGDVAPPLPDSALVDSATKGKTERLVLFAEAGCQPCAVLAADLTRRSISTGDFELYAVVDDAQFAERFRDQWNVIVDPAWGLADSWRVNGTPHVTLLDHHGRVTYNAVVNTRKEVQRLVHSGAPH